MKRRHGSTDASKIVRAIFWHEEGVCSEFVDYQLPAELPLDLDPSLAFLKSIVPTVGSHTLEKVQTSTTPSVLPTTIKNRQLAFHFVATDVFQNETDTQELTFVTLMDKLCGPPVVNELGHYITVFVPTFE